MTIKAPAEEVYGYVSDFRRHTEWNYQPQEITKVSNGPVGVGTLFRAKEKMPGKTPWVMRKIMMPVMLRLVGAAGYTEAEITAIEPGKRLAWMAVAPRRNGDAFMKANWEILLESENGFTRVTQRYHYMPAHKMAENVGSELGAQATAEEVAANLAKLKEIVEARVAADGYRQS